MINVICLPKQQTLPATQMKYFGPEALAKPSRHPGGNKLACNMEPQTPSPTFSPRASHHHTMFDHHLACAVIPPLGY
eukprot:CAMPEP_0114275702 /NCGR_PEP_ID=MMETSP0058-20121206/30475_1 /TAXON_ID=36894 /ORGANISM="Pyramimonas parkeae, CCMP726" /LENGTH=76 /DNA_ID=CAMNT_0001395649 /DNA_START=106 /DNA_END=337 /DNA_ORIENTATION=+